MRSSNFCASHKLKTEIPCIFFCMLLCSACTKHIIHLWCVNWNILQLVVWLFMCGVMRCDTCVHVYTRHINEKKREKKKKPATSSTYIYAHLSWCKLHAITEFSTHLSNCHRIISLVLVAKASNNNNWVRWHGSHFADANRAIQNCSLGPIVPLSSSLYSNEMVLFHVHIMLMQFSVSFCALCIADSNF